MILGTIIGLVSSFVPELIALLKGHLQHKYEMEMLELQIKYAQQMSDIRIAEAVIMAELEADKRVYSFARPEVKSTGQKFLDVLQVLASVYNTTVRPTLTYLLVTCWLLLKFAMWKSLGGDLAAIVLIWTSYDSEFVAAVISFWFGSRAMIRTFGKIR